MAEIAMDARTITEIQKIGTVLTAVTAREITVTEIMTGTTEITTGITEKTAADVLAAAGMARETMATGTMTEITIATTEKIVADVSAETGMAREIMATGTMTEIMIVIMTGITEKTAAAVLAAITALITIMATVADAPLIIPEEIIIGETAAGAREAAAIGITGLTWILPLIKKW